jgi:WD40 repeat protein
MAESRTGLNSHLCHQSDFGPPKRVGPFFAPAPPQPDFGHDRRFPIVTLKGHTHEIFAAAFLPDGSRLASAGRDRTIHLWDLATGDELIRLPGHNNYVFSLAFSPDGNTLVSGSGDYTVRVWDSVPRTER